MATVTLVGSTVGTTSSGSISQTGVTASVGDYLIVAIAAANSGTSGVSSIDAGGVSDSDGVNTYTLRGETNYTPGSVAGDGATFAWATCPVTDALAGATITVTFSPNVAQKAITVYRVQPGGGETLDSPTTGGGQTGSSSTPSVTKGSVAAGDIIFGGFAVETDDGITADADTTDGNWSTKEEALADAGADASAMTLVTQYKIATGTGGQTYNPTVTGGSSRDWAGVWLELEVNVSSGAMAGSSTLTFSTSGTLAGAGALAGASSLTASTAGVLAGTAAASGASSITFAPAGTMVAPGALAGASTLTFSTSGTLTGTGAAAAASSLTFSPTAALAAVGTLAGSTSLTFSGSGTLVGSGALSGTTTLTFTGEASTAEEIPSSGGGDGTFWRSAPKKRRKRKGRQEDAGLLLTASPAAPTIQAALPVAPVFDPEVEAFFADLERPRAMPTRMAIEADDEIALLLAL